MTQEQEVFIQILADHLHGMATRPVLDIDWQVMTNCAIKHQLIGIVYYQTKDWAPEEVRHTLQRLTLQTIVSADRRSMYTNAVLGALRKAGIGCFIVKGPAIARWYPYPDLRMMGDVDIVLHVEERERVHLIMQELGFTNRTKNAGREWQYYKEGLEFELHDQLVYEEDVNEACHEAFFNSFWEYVQDGKLDPNFHFLYLIQHLRKHFMNSGVGFRQFMDIAVMTRNCHELDWPWIREHLETMNMLHFALICFGFICRWFGIESPIGIEQIDGDFYEEATLKVFADGVFGFDNEDNSESQKINRLLKANIAQTAMIKHAIQDIFPSYQQLIEGGRYPYLRDRPYLLLAAWTHRGIHAIMQYRTHIGQRIANKSFVSDKKIAKRKMMLRKWGLLD